jgi:1H-pyrrole-2-carbonyl-[peptidyl-carrier protein] chlorinase
MLGGKEMDLHSKIVVDASGRNTLLGNQLKIKKKDPIFNQYAVHAWFKNVDRGIPPKDDFIHIYFLTVDRGWVWQIPINEEITSVGVVAEKDVFKNARLDYEAYFDHHCQINPDLAKAMQNAVRINDFKSEGDYSYSLENFVGDGYMMIGDAARFVDPIFSSGVSIALYSAKYGSERIRHALEINDFSAEVFRPYELKIRDGIAVWYEFIRLYYKLLPLFTHFISLKRHRIEILRLIQGDVFNRGEVPVLDAMRKYIEAVEKADKHILKQNLSSIAIDIRRELTCGCIGGGGMPATRNPFECGLSKELLCLENDHL